MDKQILLIARTKELRSALADAAIDDPRIQPILDHYIPFFEEIEAGKIMPPWQGRYRNPIFSKDSIFENKHGPGSKLSTVDAAFLSALEDWPSRPSYRRLSEHTVERPFVDWRGPDAPPSLWRLLWRVLPASQQWHVASLKKTWEGWIGR